MSDQADYDHPDRPVTAQPPPEYVPGAPSVHDLVIEDLSWRRVGQQGACRELVRLMRSRKAWGLAKYEQVLQVEDTRRRAEMDLLEELGDAIVYAYRAKARGIDGADAIYEALLAITGNAATRWFPTTGPRSAAERLRRARRPLPTPPHRTYPENLREAVTAGRDGNRPTATRPGSTPG